MRQAHFCYMRSKCRCSCVLQFTRHHRVSSVLHRPPSQMIHCIVLCFLILGPKSRVCETITEEKVSATEARHGGDQNLFRGGSSLNCLHIPQLAGGAKGVQYLKQGRPSTEADSRSSRPAETSEQGQAGPSSEEADPRRGQLVPRGCRVRMSGRGQATDNDPSAGSPTETLLRLLLPLNATVWSSSRQADRVIRLPVNPRTSLKHSIGSSDGRCVQRAGT